MNLYKKLATGIVCVALLASCNDWLDVNDNPNTPALDKVQIATLLPWAQYHVMYGAGAMSFRESFIIQATTSANKGSKEGCCAQWEPATGMVTTYYQQYFVGAGTNIRELINRGASEGAPHYEAAGRLLKALGFMIMVDTYGEMPYEESVGGPANPAYDTGEHIYGRCLENIDKAIELLGQNQDPKAPALSQGDAWNGGDVQKWIKFAYLLKARLLNNLSKWSGASTEFPNLKYDADAILACLAKAQQSNADNTIINCVDEKENSSEYMIGDPLQTNPNWDQTYSSARHNAMLTKWTTDLLENFDNKGIEDPRADKIIPWRQYRINGVKTWQRSQGFDMQERGLQPNGIAVCIGRKNCGWNPSIATQLGDSVYVGFNSDGKFNYGRHMEYADANGEKFFTSSGNVYLRPDSPWPVATYTEACFIKAEVLMRKGDTNGAFTAYKAGIKANIDYLNDALNSHPWWAENVNDGANCPSFGPMAQADIDAYLNGAIGDAGNITMAKIMTQKFLSMLFTNNNWTDFRRHDYQDYMGWKLPHDYTANTNANAHRFIPDGKQFRRFQQCSHELQKNVTQLKKAQPKYADDDIWTLPVFWDE